MQQPAARSFTLYRRLDTVSRILVCSKLTKILLNGAGEIALSEVGFNGMDRAH